LTGQKLGVVPVHDPRKRNHVLKIREKEEKAKKERGGLHTVAGVVEEVGARQDGGDAGVDLMVHHFAVEGRRFGQADGLGRDEHARHVGQRVQWARRVVAEEELGQDGADAGAGACAGRQASSAGGTGSCLVCHGVGGGLAARIPV
jgi:hypothetical protein